MSNPWRSEINLHHRMSAMEIRIGQAEEVSETAAPTRNQIYGHNENAQSREKENVMMKMMKTVIGTL